MNRFSHVHVALVLCSVVFSGCSVLGIPNSGSATAQGSAAKQSQRVSWSLPEAQEDNLLYVSSPNVGVYVYSYPQGKLVGMLSGFEYAVGECSDADGNVFVTDNGEQDVVEYPHAGTTPIATFNDSGNYPLSCAVDPSSGDLAVAGGTTFSGGKSTLAVFTSPSSPPTVYTDFAVAPFYFCTYDTNGDLFVEGGLGQGPSAEAALDELPKDGDALSELHINKRIRAGGAVQWDGEYLAFGSPSLMPTDPRPSTKCKPQTRQLLSSTRSSSVARANGHAILRASSSG